MKIEVESVLWRRTTLFVFLFLFSLSVLYSAPVFYSLSEEEMTALETKLNRLETLEQSQVDKSNQWEKESAEQSTRLTASLAGEVRLSQENTDLRNREAFYLNEIRQFSTGLRGASVSLRDSLKRSEIASMSIASLNGLLSNAKKYLNESESEALFFRNLSLILGGVLTVSIIVNIIQAAKSWK